MGEFKNKMLEQVEDHQESFNEVINTGEMTIEERDENRAILNSLEGVDDDDVDSIEEGKEQGQEIGAQLAESTLESPKNEINSEVDSTIDETNDYKDRELNDANIAGSMDGNYGGIGSDLESKFEDSADEFSEIADRGMEVKDESNDTIDEQIQRMEEEW